MLNLNEMYKDVFMKYSRGIYDWDKFKNAIDELGRLEIEMLFNEHKHRPVRTRGGEVWCLSCLGLVKEAA